MADNPVTIIVKDILVNQHNRFLAIASLLL